MLCDCIIKYKHFVQVSQQTINATLNPLINRPIVRTLWKTRRPIQCIVFCAFSTKKNQNQNTILLFDGYKDCLYLFCLAPFPNYTRSRLNYAYTVVTILSLVKLQGSVYTHAR